MNEVKIYFLKEKPEVIPVISRWVWEEWSKDRKTLERQEKEYRLKTVTDRVPLSLVAFFDDEVAGTISIVENDIDEILHLKPWIAVNYVGEKFRNKGISTAMLKRAEEVAKDIGIKKIYLGTETTTDFYQKRGYTKIDEVYYKGEKTDIFEKEL